MLTVDSVRKLRTFMLLLEAGEDVAGAPLVEESSGNDSVPEELGDHFEVGIATVPVGHEAAHQRGQPVKTCDDSS